jgi:Sigma-70 region 2
MDHAAIGAHGGDDPQETTAILIAKVRAGDTTAKERLFTRCLPVLRRWAHHRLPHRLRGVGDTDDLVQETLLRALRNLNAFEVRWRCFPRTSSRRSSCASSSATAMPASPALERPSALLQAGGR